MANATAAKATSIQPRFIRFGKLPTHLQKMALFKVNRVCREQEVCS